jgi:hypothetical protein
MRLSARCGVRPVGNNHGAVACAAPAWASGVASLETGIMMNWHMPVVCKSIERTFARPARSISRTEAATSTLQQQTEAASSTVQQSACSGAKRCPASRDSGRVRCRPEEAAGSVAWGSQAISAAWGPGMDLTTILRACTLPQLEALCSLSWYHTWQSEVLQRLGCASVQPAALRQWADADWERHYSQLQVQSPALHVCRSCAMLSASVPLASALA